MNMILKYPNPILRKQSKLIDGNTDINELLLLCKKLECELKNSEVNGVALSAIQIGEPIQLFVLAEQLIQDTKFKSNIIINPTILKFDGERVNINEGCLSFPGIFLKVKRWTSVSVKYDTIIDNTFYRDINVELKDFYAQIFQHEIDHMNGKLFVDFLSVKRKLQIVKMIK